jgi:hypothetical protein
LLPLPAIGAHHGMNIQFFCANFADGAILFAYCNIPLKQISVEWMQDRAVSVSAARTRGFSRAIAFGLLSPRMTIPPLKGEGAARRAAGGVLARCRWRLSNRKKER